MENKLKEAGLKAARAINKLSKSLKLLQKKPYILPKSKFHK